MSASFGQMNRVSADYLLSTTMTCDNNYQTGGYQVTPGTFGFGVSIDDVFPLAQSATLIAEWVAATSSIRISQDSGSGLVEVTPGTDLHTLNVLLLAFGR